MRSGAMLLALMALPCAGISAAKSKPLPNGTYTNAEDSYFATEAKQPTIPWIGVTVAAGNVQSVDAFGAVVTAPVPLTTLKPEKGKGGALTLTLPDGRTTQLRRARPVTCWAAVRKSPAKAAGAPDWHFMRDVKMHDQGGRALIGQAVAGAEPVVIRLRSVTWSGSRTSSNRPSLVLYVHKPDEPDQAVSYAWADEGAARIGINLRWMQASCTIDGMEKPSQVSSKTFRG